MPSERELFEESVGLELDELVAMGDIEMIIDTGEVYYRLTEQGYARLREKSQEMN